MPIHSNETFEPAPLRWFVIPLVIAAALLVVDRTTDLDRILTRLAYDAAAGDFPLRGNFWLEVVMHQWLKSAVITLAALIVGAVVLSYVLPPLAAHRRLLLYLALAIGLAPLSVTAGKAMSARHCPWDIEEFGGSAPYVRMLEAAPADVKAGHCFPAGHASTGFALMVFYFAAYARRLRKTALAALGAGIACGLVLGAGRVLQGAHFPSHVLWSGLVCWCVMVVLYVVCLDGSLPVTQRAIALLARVRRSGVAERKVLEDETRA